MSEVGEKSPEVEGYLGVHLEKQPVYVSIFRNDVGLILLLFPCTSQQSTIEINILHWLWWICTRSGGRLRLCAAGLCIIFSHCETSLWETFTVRESETYQFSTGKAFWSGPTQSEHFALIRYLDQHVWLTSRLQLTAWHGRHFGSYLS